MTNASCIYAGIDAGSRAIKLVIFDAGKKSVIASASADQALKQADRIKYLMTSTLNSAGLTQKDIAAIVSTGYGRNNVPFACKTVTEITCHARGATFLIPGVRTVVDIGGQDSKIIRIDGSGRVHDFIMNDRCAAGTGRFLEIVAKKLEIDFPDHRATYACQPSLISSMCVVFAETEIIGLLANGEKTENIFAGVQMAVASRIHTMSGRQITGPVVFTGGVARIPGMPESLEKNLNCKISLIREPHMAGALGAALIAAD